MQPRSTLLRGTISNYLPIDAPVLVFALAVVKVKRGGPMQGYDHVVQPESVPAGSAQP